MSSICNWSKNWRKYAFNYALITDQKTKKKKNHVFLCPRSQSILSAKKETSFKLENIFKGDLKLMS